MPQETWVGSEESQDENLNALRVQIAKITEAWAKRHDLWYDSAHKDPMTHYDDEPVEGGPLLLLCSDGPAMTALEWDDEYAQELRNELEAAGVYLTMEDRVTASDHLIESDSKLQKQFDRYAQWRWICRLVEADSEEISGNLYQHFADIESLQLA